MKEKQKCTIWSGRKAARKKEIRKIVLPEELLGNSIKNITVMCFELIEMLRDSMENWTGGTKRKYEEKGELFKGKKLKQGVKAEIVIWGGYQTYFLSTFVLFTKLELQRVWDNFGNPNCSYHFNTLEWQGERKHYAKKKRKWCENVGVAVLEFLEKCFSKSLQRPEQNIER